jgi:hypothetical protein
MQGTVQGLGLQPSLKVGGAYDEEVTRLGTGWK